jgi:methionyl-tRNA formyltransferase
MGTPSFAVPCLQALVASHDVVAVYTRPDKPSGRGRALKPSPVKVAATAAGIHVVQPASLRDEEAVPTLSSFEPDACVVAAYGAILSRDVLAVPRLGCVNVHASLLPRWRGAAPVQRAILAGDDVTGVSIMRMEAGLDTGPFAAQVQVPLDDLGTEALTEALASVAPAALLATLEALTSGTVEWTEQDESLATYAAKVTTADVALAPALSRLEAFRRVRASSRSAAARCVVAGVGVTVSVLADTEAVAAPGEVVVTRRELVLGFADGALAVEGLTPNGRSPMDGASFGRGLHSGGAMTWEGPR